MAEVERNQTLANMTLKTTPLITMQYFWQMCQHLFNQPLVIHLVCFQIIPAKNNATMSIVVYKHCCILHFCDYFFKVYS